MRNNGGNTGRQVARGSACQEVNVGEVERLVSAAGGGLLTLYGLRHGGLSGLALAALGSSLICRCVTGRCALYRSLGVCTSQHSPQAAVAAGHGIRVEQSVTLDRPAEDLYREWRHFENLPRFMSHLVSVRSEGRRSHWAARGPAGANIEWDAEIVNDQPNRLIAWRSLEGSEVQTAGSVHFVPRAGGHGSDVHVNMKYDVPGGKLGSWLAWLFGHNPEQKVREDLQRFKQRMEQGATVGAR